MILCVCPNPSIDTLVTVDDLSPGQVHRARNEERFPGGKGVHVALAAAELGAEVTLLAFWAGPSGKWIREQCERAGVRCIGPEVKGWSRSCITFRSRGPYSETELLGLGPRLREKDIENLEVCLRETASQVSVVTLSGSWPSGASSDSYARLLDIINARQKPAILDCTGAMLPPAMLRRPHTVHLNRQEAQEFTGEEDPSAAARALGRSGCVAIVTAGADGAFICDHDRLIHVSCKIDARHSAVGSGDCFVAGMAFGCDAGLDIDQTAAFAAACGAANCLCPKLGMLRHEDVKQLIDQVKLRELQ